VWQVAYFYRVRLQGSSLILTKSLFDSIKRLNMASSIENTGERKITESRKHDTLYFDDGTFVIQVFSCLLQGTMH